MILCFIFKKSSYQQWSTTFYKNYLRHGFRWDLMCKWLRGVKGVSQQVFPSVTEELAFMNLNYKLGCYCQKMDDGTGSHSAMAHSQGFLVKCCFHWMHKQASFFLPHSCCFYWLALDVTVRTGSVGGCQLLSGTTVQSWCQPFVYFVLPTCTDCAWGAQHMDGGLKEKSFLFYCNYDEFVKKLQAIWNAEFNNIGLVNIGLALDKIWLVWVVC